MATQWWLVATYKVQAILYVRLQAAALEYNSTAVVVECMQSYKV